MRSAIDRDADPQQMIPKLTCVLLKLVRPSFRNSSNCALAWIFRETRACLGADKRKCLSCKA